MLLGGIELGGTKIMCCVGDENGNIFEKKRIPTLEAGPTMEAVTEFFEGKNVEAFGVASFGPIELNENKPSYGHILTSPKKDWNYFDITEALRKFNVPMKLDTDVNGSCIGECNYGAAKGLGNVLYLTVGTGIGTGIVINGKTTRGILHPEGGHILLNKRADDKLKSVCPYHENCAEGLASGPAIKARWGKPAEELLDKEEVWELEADYLAQAIANYVMVLSPEKIILGGGVMHVTKLFPMIREKVLSYLGGYIVADELRDMDRYIVPAGLGDDQGLIGCLCLAREAVK